VKVIEVINFLHEVDLLEAHLDEHQHFMTEIVVVESAVTYSGMPKPLFFQNYKHRFSRFNIKYEEIPIDLFEPIPGTYPESERKRWFDARRNNRERQQQYIFAKYKGLGDYFCNSDVDEIWSRNCWEYALDCMKQNYCYICPRVRRFQNYIDAVAKKQDFWRITRSDMSTHFRQRGTKRGRTEEMGWHFSACYKDPLSLWYKGVGLAQSTGYLGYNAVPTPEQIEKIVADGFIPFLNVKMEPGYGVMSKDDLSWLPPFMASNPHLYPWLPDNIREGKQISDWKLK